MHLSFFHLYILKHIKLVIGAYAYLYIFTHLHISIRDTLSRLYHIEDVVDKFYYHDYGANSSRNI